MPKPAPLAHTALLSIARVSASADGMGVRPVVARFGAVVLRPLARACASERQGLPSMVTAPPLRFTPRTKPAGGGGGGGAPADTPEHPIRCGSPDTFTSPRSRRPSLTVTR